MATSTTRPGDEPARRLFFCVSTTGFGEDWRGESRRESRRESELWVRETLQTPRTMQTPPQMRAAEGCLTRNAAPQPTANRLPPIADASRRCPFGRRDRRWPSPTRPAGATADPIEGDAPEAIRRQPCRGTTIDGDAGGPLRWRHCRLRPAAASLSDAPQPAVAAESEARGVAGRDRGCVVRRSKVAADAMAGACASTLVASNPPPTFRSLSDDHRPDRSRSRPRQRRSGVPPSHTAGRGVREASVAVWALEARRPTCRPSVLKAAGDRRCCCARARAWRCGPPEEDGRR